MLTDFLDATSDYSHVPFMVGILPLASAKNAEFLHNEVPGMQIPEPVRRAIHAAPTKQAQREFGIKTAHETLSALRDHPRIRGAYIYPPFGSYKAILRVIDGLVDTDYAETH